MLSKCANCTRLHKIKKQAENRLFSWQKKSKRILYGQKKANSPRCLTTISNPTNTAGIMNIEGEKK